MRRLIAALLYALLLLSAPAWSVGISGTAVQCKSDTNGSTTSLTVDGADGWATPTAGNKLVSILSLRNNATSASGLTKPTGFTDVQSATTTSGNFGSSYLVSVKDAIGDETTFTVSWTTTSLATVTICEFSGVGLATGNPVASGEDETHKTSNTQTQSTGSASNTKADALAVGIVTPGKWFSWKDSGGPAWAAFISQHSSNPGSSDYPFVLVATKVATSIASQSDTVTTADTGGTTGGVILAYDSEATAPTISVALAQTGISTDTVSATFTATDASGGYTGYCGTYADGSTPTAANVIAGAGTGFVASTAYNTGAIATGVQTSYTSGANLSAATAYDVDCVAQDAVHNNTAVQKIDVTTDAAPGTDAVLPVMIFDPATAADTTTFAGRSPPTNTPGNTYSVVKFLTSATISTVTVVSNKMSAGARTGAVIDVETTDMISRADIADYTVDHNVATRYSNSDNYNRCKFTPTSNQVLLETVVAGTFTAIATTSYTFTGSYVGEMFAVGTSVGCVIDGVLVNSATTSANASATKGGFGAAAATATFDNVYIKRAYPCLNSSTGRVNDDPTGLFFGETTNLTSGCSYWADTLPVKTYVAWSLYEGGGWYYDPEIAFVGNDTFNWKRWNPFTNALESATWTYTTQGVVNTVPVWSGTPDQSWAIGVPKTLDLTLYQSARGIPPSVCTVQAGALVAGMVLNGPSCIINGTPSVGAATPTSVTIRATSTALTADDTFTQTITGDTIPDSVPDENITGIAAGAGATECTAFTVSGINVPAAITVSGSTNAKYSINAGAYTAAAGTVVAGDVIGREVDASGSDSVVTTVKTTIGGVSGTCSVLTTPPLDTTPDAFTFGQALGVALNSSQSACTTILGLEAQTAVTSSGGNCTVNGGAASTSCGNAQPQTQTGVDDDGNPVYTGSTICALHTAAATTNTAVNTLVTVGGIVGTFTSVTAPDVPVCQEIPTQNVIVGQVVNLDLSTFCTGTINYSSGSVPAALTVSGGVISGVVTAPTTTATRRMQTQFQATNNDGSTNIVVAWNVSTNECKRSVLEIIKSIFRTARTATCTY